MGYYVRVLSTADDTPSTDALRAALARDARDVLLEADGSSAWTEATLTHPSGVAIATIERNTVLDGDLGGDELRELIDEVRDGRPASAARWLEEYLARVRTIFAIRVLSGADSGNGWDAIGAVKNELWASAPSAIIQADLEGFSNEDGYHVLWQFPEHVTGEWHMAVLDERGTWTKFVMELGDRSQRAAFLAGGVPAGRLHHPVSTDALDVVGDALKLLSMGSAGRRCEQAASTQADGSRPATSFGCTPAALGAVLGVVPSGAVFRWTPLERAPARDPGNHAQTHASARPCTPP